jgi:SAM-dependent methyltransferase
MSIVFEDLNEYNGNGSFPVCNESIAMWRKALKDISVENAAGICSGGEVSFFAVLPCVKKQLQLVDHSYQSMYYALGKYHTVEKLGAKKAHKAFSQGAVSELEPLIEEANQGFSTGAAFRKGYSRLSGGDLRGIFRDISEKDVQAFKKNQKKVKFLHGDLSDLVERGPFDLVYLSNALDYTGRHHSHNHPVEKLVKPGGIVCCTSSSYGGRSRLSKAFEILFSEAGAGPIMSWTYVVGQLKEAA